MGLIKKRVLVLESHVDDATCGCAGTILKHLERGDTVQWHTFIGEGYRVPYKWNPKTLRIEWKYAMKALGIKDSHIHDYRVDTLDVVATELRDLIFKIWHEFDPDIAYVPWRKSRHQDHRAVGDFAYQVSWRSDADVLAYTVPNDFAGFEPNVFSVLDEDTYLAKLEVIENFASQFILRSWFTLDLVGAFMETYSPFGSGDAQYVESFEQVKRVIT